ncbi:MAG: hypothetical protein Q4G42_08640 [Neisseria sp.]|nr:hypothetical protein [Neisseria sp.]
MSDFDYAAALQGCLKAQNTPLKRHDLSNGESVWVRQLNRGNPRIYYVLLDWLTRYVLRLPILRPAYRGGSQAIAAEARRLRDLAAANILAPRLLAENTDGLMMSDLCTHQSAQTFDSRLEHADDVVAVWCEGVDALFALHERGQYLSQAFARNILYLDDGRWAFIDFEEDPAELLDLASCQVRDQLLLLHSTAHYLPDLDAAAAYWRAKLQHIPEDTAALFHHTVSRLAWTQKVRLIRHLGRDGRRVAKALDLLAKIIRK